MNYTALERGGYLVETPVGKVQFGSPPETIKDTLKSQGGVPQIFVLPDRFFSWTKGISVAELEFPLYFNYFLRNQRTYIICSEEQYHGFREVLRESVFGPRQPDLAQDYPADFPAEKLPSVPEEMAYFRGNRKLSDLVQFGIFKNGQFQFRGLRITKARSGFSVHYRSELIAEVPATIEYRPKYDIGERLREPFEPPLFGVTCLGPSHGFDPEQNTSGYVVWLNRVGIMVDPPVNSTEWLVDSNVNPKQIDSIILTHCHADHDAGTFQKILEEGRISIYTTPTVMQSFLTKYSAFTGVSPEYLQKLFDFRPVTIGQPVFLHGGRFEMFYTLHSLPTLGFKMSFQNQTFVYSSDHNNDPALHRKLYDEGVISKTRYEELSAFPWDSRVIYHESGIPPLHTPIAVLAALPEEVQKNVVVYHIAEKDIPAEGHHLRLARFGIENTLYFETTAPEWETPYAILGALRHLDFFAAMPVGKAQEFIGIVREEKFRRGETIIRKGTVGDRFFIIRSGNVSVVSEGLESRKIYGAYDYFGEAALMTTQPRTADVIAETDVIAFTVAKDEFLNFIAGTDFEAILRRLTKVRDAETWNVLSNSRSFAVLTATQKTYLESMLHKRSVSRGTVLLPEGEQARDFIIIRNGNVEVTNARGRVATISRGDFIGTFSEIERNSASAYTFSAATDCDIYRIEKDDILRFMDKNPGLIMKLGYEFA